MIGIAGGFAAAMLARSLLFRVSAWDPAIFAIVTALLAIVTLAASYIPARTQPRWTRWWRCGTNKLGVLRIFL